MTDLQRFGVSIDKKLLAQFDAMIKAQKYTNRSEALRDLIRDAMVRRSWEEGQRVAGALTIVYDHSHRELTNKLTYIQHQHLDLIISSQHIHLDHDQCMEIIAVRGAATQVQKLADELHALKGVKHHALNVSGIHL